VKNLAKRAPQEKLMDRKITRSKSFRDLEVWKLSIEIVKNIYQLTNKFPNSEIYGLIAQLRRSAISIPSNIAEGQGRNSAKEFQQFLAIALGSRAELETQLVISKEVNHLTERDLSPLLTDLDIVRKMIKALSISLK
jgi:four helix bundle protein